MLGWSQNHDFLWLQQGQGVEMSLVTATQEVLPTGIGFRGRDGQPALAPEELSRGGGRNVPTAECSCDSFHGTVQGDPWWQGGEWQQ